MSKLQLPLNRAWLLTGLFAAGGATGFFIWQHGAHDPGSPLAVTAPAFKTHPAAASASEPEAPVFPAVHGQPAPETAVKPVATAQAKAVSREMDIHINPYAGALKEPGKSKRAWDENYIRNFDQAKGGDTVKFELTHGVMAEGVVKILQYDDAGQVSYVSGELAAPETGKFFFLTPPAGGKAGAAVGVVEFPESATAYRVEPTGANGLPELWQRRLDEVVCVGMQEPDMDRLNALEGEKARKKDAGTEAASPLRPDLAQEYTTNTNANIVSLQSYPGSGAVLLLDFAGGYTPSWGGVTYTRPAIDNDTIRDIWKRVAEDFMPFNINVTTDEQIYLAAPKASRQRCCFGPNPVTGSGVAYFGSWNWGDNTVCWSAYYVGKAAAEVGAHEPGHTLGLAHQGQDIPDGSGGFTHNEYFAGQGSGETGWCPIMGASYYQPVTTWAKGEYQYASQTQDELLVITTTNNNVGYRNDDTGTGLANSRYLDVNPDNSVFAEGVIERTADTDSFQFTTTGGAVTLTAKPVAEGDWGDLGISATIADASNTVVATNNVQTLTSASISTTLTAGTYTFNVTGASKGDPVTNGFSSYSSQGYYSISGSVAGARQPSRLSVYEKTANNTVIGTVVANNPNSSPLVYSIASGNTGGTFSIDNNGVVRVSNNALLDYYALALSPSLYSPRFELFVNITNTNNSAYNETNRRVLIDVQKVLPPKPAGVTAAVDTGARIKVSWMGSKEATSYNVKRSTTPGGPYTTVATVVGTNYADASVNHGLTYYYVVTAVNGYGETANSSEASARAQAYAGLGFESPALGGFTYNVLNNVWTFSSISGGGSGIMANGSGFGNPTAPEGSQCAFIQTTGTITQTFSGFTPGATYVISYAAAQRSGSSQHGGESWDVKIDGSVIQSNSPGSTNWTNYTTTFVASASTHTLSFVGTDLATGDNTVFLDDIQISQVVPTIGNPSFETPTTGGFAYNPAGGSWTFTAQSGNNGSGIAANGSGFSNPAAATGNQVAFVQATGSVSQALTGFTVGRTYTLTYSAAERPGNVQTWDVKLDGTVIQSNPAGSGAFGLYSVNFTATSTSHTLTFAGTNLAGGDNTVFIDNVRLVSPPAVAAPVVTLTNPTNGGVYTTPGSLSFTASVTANGNAINGVDFYADGATLIGTATTSPYSYTWTNPAAGRHLVTARARFNGSGYAESATAKIAVVNSNQDLSFESPALSGGSFQYTPTGGSWTFAGYGGNGSGLASNGSGFGNPNAPAGSQAALLQGVCRVYQTLSGFTAGNVYTVTYSAAQRGGAAQHGGQTWNVIVDDNVVASNNTPGSTSYTTYTATFTATSAVQTIGFAGTDLLGGDNTVFIDNVSIASVLAPPTGLAATAGNAQASLTWTASTGATGYNVKRSTTSGGPYTAVGSPASASFTDSGLTNGTTYYYVVTALKSGGESGNSGQATATPQVTIANASFENLVIANYQYSPTGASWTFAGASPSGSGLIANGSGFSNPNAPAGTQAAFVQQTGTMSQTLTGLNVGTSYTVTFAAAQRSGANQHGGESWNVKVDSTLVGSYNPGPAATTYVDYTATFTATASSQTLAFVGTDLVGGDNTVFIDNVRIAQTTPTVPSPWAKQDIGVSGGAGSAKYAGGVYTVTGGGTNVSGTADSITVLSQASSADCSMTLRVASLPNTNANAKAGVMIRESLNANASEAGVWVTPGSGIVFTSRTSTGGTTATSVATGLTAPYWVRVVRTGNSFAAYYSSSGSTWTQLGTAVTISMSSSAYLTMGVDSGDVNQLNTATLDNVTATP